MFNPIASGFSPNVERDDIFLALLLLLQPRKWRAKADLVKLTNWFSARFRKRASKVYLFNAGRSALFVLLKAARIGKGDEVLVQAFTCAGAVEPILWVGARPIYADIKKDNFNINPEELRKKITKKTKAIIVQHTFGIPAQINKIKRIAQKNNLLLIEDCAHALGGKVDKTEVGMFGDAAFFSFGRDKVVSSVFGGASVIHNPLKFRLIDKIYNKLEFPNSKWIFQQLLHPIAFAVILPLYKLQIGKILLVALQKLGLLSKPYVKAEYAGKKPKNFPERLPAALAQLALNQLYKLDKFNKKRIQIAKKYGKVNKEAIYLRYPVLVDDPQKVYSSAKNKGIILGRWYSNVIDPSGVDLNKFGYRLGSCPVAEEVAKKIINLPTYPRMRDKEVEKVKKERF